MEGEGRGEGWRRECNTKQIADWRLLGYVIHKSATTVVNRGA